MTRNFGVNDSSKRAQRLKQEYESRMRTWWAREGRPTTAARLTADDPGPRTPSSRCPVCGSTSTQDRANHMPTPRPLSPSSRTLLIVSASLALWLFLAALAYMLIGLWPSASPAPSGSLTPSGSSELAKFLDLKPGVNERRIALPYCDQSGQLIAKLDRGSYVEVLCKDPTP